MRVVDAGGGCGWWMRVVDAGGGCGRWMRPPPECFLVSAEQFRANSQTVWPQPPGPPHGPLCEPVALDTMITTHIYSRFLVTFSDEEGACRHPDCFLVSAELFKIP